MIFCNACVVTKVGGTLGFNYKLTGAIFRRRRMQYTSSSSEADIWARNTIHRTRQSGLSVNPGVNCRGDRVFDLRFIYGLPVKHKDKSREAALRNPYLLTPPPPHKKAMLNLKAAVVGFIQIERELLQINFANKDTCPLVHLSLIQTSSKIFKLKCRVDFCGHFSCF